jgi:hypothetical protein
MKRRVSTGAMEIEQYQLPDISLYHSPKTTSDPELGRYSRRNVLYLTCTLTDGVPASSLLNRSVAGQIGAARDTLQEKLNLVRAP